MEKAKLLNGMELPMVGLGTWQAQEGPQAYEAVLNALDAGYRSFDTAYGYGNEVSVGKAIRDSGIPREEIFVTTKLTSSMHGYEKGIKGLQESLDNLNVGYIDLFLMHWPRRDYVETWPVFEYAYHNGLARAIGGSNFLKHHIEEIRDQCEIMPMTDQLELHPYLYQDETVNFCQENGILVEAWSPMMQGGPALQDPVIAGIAAAHGKSAAQVILRWHVQKGVRVIPKSVNPGRMKENLEIFDFQLTSDEMAAMNELTKKNVRRGGHPDDVK